MNSSSDSIKSSPFDGNTACSLIATTSSNPNSPHVVKFNSSGNYECDVDCIRCKSYKICSHTVAGAKHKLELKVEVNDLVDVNMPSKVGQKKSKGTQKGKWKPQNQSINTTPAIYISPVSLNLNSNIMETRFSKVLLIQTLFHSTPSDLNPIFQ